MSDDSASHDDVAGLFKRLGARAGAPQYHDFSHGPAPAAGAPAAAAMPASVPAPPAAAANAAPPPPIPPVPEGPAVPAQASAETPLQRLFQRLAQAPLQNADQSPLARLRQR